MPDTKPEMPESDDPWLLLRRKFSTAAAIDGEACFNATGCRAICDLMDSIATVHAEAIHQRDEARRGLADLLSWFPEKPSPPEWRILAGQYGADDALHAARAIVEGRGNG